MKYVECFNCSENLFFEGDNFEHIECPKCHHLNHSNDFDPSEFKFDDIYDIIDKAEKNVEKLCPKCGLQQNPDASFCRECGEDLGRFEAVQCPKCKKLYPQTYRFCEKDGSDLEITTVREEEYTKLNGQSEDNGKSPPFASGLHFSTSDKAPMQMEKFNIYENPAGVTEAVKQGFKPCSCLA